MSINLAQMSFRNLPSNFAQMSSPLPPTASIGTSRPGELREWHGLFSDGLITEAEYKDLKAKLLAAAFDPIVAECIVVHPRGGFPQPAMVSAQSSKRRRFKGLGERRPNVGSSEGRGATVAEQQKGVEEEGTEEKREKVDKPPMEEDEDVALSSEEEKAIANRDPDALLSRFVKKSTGLLSGVTLQSWGRRLTMNSARRPEDVKNALIDTCSSFVLIFLLMFSALVAMVAELDLDTSGETLASGVDMAFLFMHFFAVCYLLSVCIFSLFTASTLNACSERNIRTFMTGLGQYLYKALQNSMMGLVVTWNIWLQLLIAHFLTSVPLLGKDGGFWVRDARWFVHLLMHVAPMLHFLLPPVTMLWRSGSQIIQLTFHACMDDTEPLGPVCPEAEDGEVLLSHEEALQKITRRALADLALHKGEGRAWLSRKADGTRGHRETELVKALASNEGVHGLSERSKSLLIS